jgi:cytochrome P450
VKYRTAYASFSIGAFSWIGKQLALMEIRFVVHDLVARFGIRLVDSETGEGLINATMDIFTVELGELR